MPQHHKDGFHPDAMSVHESEMLVATADASDEPINRVVSEAAKGEAALSKDDSNPMDEAWGQRILDRRLTKTLKDTKKPVGHATAPAKAADAGTYLRAMLIKSVHDFAATGVIHR